MPLHESSGNLFGLTQNAGMDWNPDDVGRAQYLIVSTRGGLRDSDGRPTALGFHTGHWEIELLVCRAPETLREQGGIAFYSLLQRSL
jgi:xylonate dehydratase